MHHPILPISERGQITIPKNIRKKISVKYFTCHLEGGEIILKPMQTREEFITELEEREKDWEKNGGISWEDAMKKANL